MEKQNRVRERWLSTRPKKLMQKSLRNVPDLAKRAEVLYLSERWPDAANDTIKGCTSVSVNDSVCVVVCVLGSRIFDCSYNNETVVSICASIRLLTCD